MYGPHNRLECVHAASRTESRPRFRAIKVHLAVLDSRVVSPRPRIGGGVVDAREQHVFELQLRAHRLPRLDKLSHGRNLTATNHHVDEGAPPCNAVTFSVMRSRAVSWARLNCRPRRPRRPRMW